MQSSKPIHHPRISPELAAALAALATLALIYFAWPVYRAFLPLQIDINEAWNAYQKDMLRAGQSLYSSNDFITNNYPPLSFYVVNALAAAACRTNDGTTICAHSVVHAPWSDAIPLCGYGRSSSERRKTALDKPDL
jgi:hypothetical protein